MLLPLTVALLLFAGVALLAGYDLVAVIAAALAPINEALVAQARARALAKLPAAPAEPEEEPEDG